MTRNLLISTCIRGRLITIGFVKVHLLCHEYALLTISLELLFFPNYEQWYGNVAGELYTCIDCHSKLHILLKPAQYAFVVVTQVVALAQTVTLAGVNYQLGRNIALF